jgi:HD-GYP domain-containing protein (c-di-GMP phosphodiesterase class II)
MTGEIANAALSHHEYLDGSGYPNGLSAAGIDDTTRILTICDIFSAMIERRPYKEPRSPEEAYGTLLSMGGKLDQDLVRVFEDVAAECTGLDRSRFDKPTSGIDAFGRRFAAE